MNIGPDPDGSNPPDSGGDLPTPGPPPVDRPTEPAAQPVRRPPAALPRQADDEPTRVPDWLREPELDGPLTLGQKVALARQRASGVVLYAVGILVVLSLIGMTGWVVLNWRDANRNDQSTRRATPGAVGPTVLSAVSTAGPGAPSQAFAGTPVATFPTSVSGITMPEPSEQAPFTRDQVADALAAVRAALTLGRLDRRLAINGDPNGFLSVLAGTERADLQKVIGTADFPSYATRLAPDASLTDEPRVKGRVSYHTGTGDQGLAVLEVTTSFVWVYSFSTDEQAPGAGLVVVHDEIVWQAPHPSDVRGSARGLSIMSAGSFLWNVDCAAADQGMLAPRTGSLFRGLPKGDSSDALFDPNHSFGGGATC